MLSRSSLFDPLAVLLSRVVITQKVSSELRSDILVCLGSIFVLLLWKWEAFCPPGYSTNPPISYNSRTFKWTPFSMWPHLALMYYRSQQLACLGPFDRNLPTALSTVVAAVIFSPLKANSIVFQQANREVVPINSTSCHAHVIWYWEWFGTTKTFPLGFLSPRRIWLMQPYFGLCQQTLQQPYWIIWTVCYRSRLLSLALHSSQWDQLALARTLAVPFKFCTIKKVGFVHLQNSHFDLQCRVK